MKLNKKDEGTERFL